MFQKRRTWLVIAGVFGSACVLILGISSPLWGPLRDDWVMDGEVLGIAMDWRDFGRSKAVERIAWVIENRQLQGSLSSEDCELTEATNKLRQIKCMWSVEVKWPFLDWVWPLEFEANASINGDGEVFVP